MGYGFSLRASEPGSVRGRISGPKKRYELVYFGYCIGQRAQRQVLTAPDQSWPILIQRENWLGLVRV